MIFCPPAALKISSESSRTEMYAPVPRKFLPCWRTKSLFFLGGAVLFLTGTIVAAEPPPAQPVVAVMIDDLGEHLDDARRVTALPGPVACAILPHTTHAVAIANLAHSAGKEVLLHLPMESVGD